ncbi:2'-5' RNA ligase family protein [Amycolatopsis sp. NPDC098790]|uniref:2'-5' RNA ligase family protein n=1 Tax=Amycolatopsis sp. NPDC098790 TaxID=3363939 RepID=UPI003818E061
MEPHFQPDRLWPAGHRELQLMIIPDLRRDDELARLVKSCRDILGEHPATTQPVPDHALHLTVQPIRPPHGGTVDPAIRAALITALGPVLADVPAFEMLIGSVLTQARGVIADTHHNAPFDALVERVRPAIAQLCGPDSVTHDSRPAHMALCYADGHGCSGALQRHLRPSHARITVNAIDLVETIQDPEHCHYASTVLHSFPLAEATR